MKFEPWVVALLAQKKKSKIEGSQAKNSWLNSDYSQSGAVTAWVFWEPLEQQLSEYNSWQERFLLGYIYTSDLTVRIAAAAIL